MKILDKESRCSKCGSLNNAAQSMEQEDLVPHPGDFTVCGYCGEISIFNDDMEMVPPTFEQLKDAQEKSPADYNLIMEAHNGIINMLGNGFFESK